MRQRRLIESEREKDQKIPNFVNFYQDEEIYAEYYNNNFNANPTEKPNQKNYLIKNQNHPAPTNHTHKPEFKYTFNEFTVKPKKVNKKKTIKNKSPTKMACFKNPEDARSVLSGCEMPQNINPGNYPNSNQPKPTTTANIPNSNVQIERKRSKGLRVRMNVNHVPNTSGNKIKKIQNKRDQT